MDAMKNILSGKAVSEIVDRFKNETWPKIKALVVVNKLEETPKDDAVS